ncbi:MAG: serine protease [Alphaproteobacteria bacterium]|nr:serine protease [Alphaproteobacteria bacterium]MDX5492861.1 serine protease [Alphaproteobacteria bacterium]
MRAHLPTYGQFLGAAEKGIAEKSHIRAQTFSVTPIELLGEDDKDLNIHGTGFFYKHNDESYLVTSWHNVSGLNPFTFEHMNKGGVVPKSLKFYSPLRVDYPDGRLQIFRVPVQISLWEEWHYPLWLEHPQFDELRIDLAAFPVPVEDSKLIPAWHVADGDDFDLLSIVGADIFVLGYPYKNYVGTMPAVWKRGSLASEPLISVDGRPMFLVDAASRPGMSGSPVFRHQFGPAVDKSMAIKLDNVVTTRFVGVYSGHLQSGVDELSLGFAWSSHLVEELVSMPKAATRRYVS